MINKHAPWALLGSRVVAVHSEMDWDIICVLEPDQIKHGKKIEALPELINACNEFIEELEQVNDAHLLECKYPHYYTMKHHLSKMIEADGTQK